MTNAKSLALVVVSLGGTVTGRTNAGLLADIVRALGGTPTGNTNADLIGQIAAALGGEAGEGTNADRLRAVADALDVDASGTNAEVLAAILTGLGGEPGAGDTNAALIMGISEHPPGPGPTPTPKYTVRFHVATDSVGYGSVSPASASGVEEGTAVSATGQAVLIGGVSKCTATPAADTAEYDYAFVKWTGADDADTPAPASITQDTHYYAHFSRTPVTPEPMDPSLFTFTVADGNATVTGWAGSEPEAGYDLWFPTTDGNGHPLMAIGDVASSGTSPWTGAATVRADSVANVGDRAFKQAALASVSLPAATSIGLATFRECTSLASVSLPAATSIGNSAFSDCTSLASVSLPAATSIGTYAFRGCTAATSVTLGPLTGTLGSDAFSVWTFYDSDGVTVLDKTVAANLANSTFEGTASALVKTAGPMSPSLFTFTVADGEATVTGWAGTPPADGYDLWFPTTDGDGHPLTGIGGSSSNSYVSVFAGAATVRGDSIVTVGDRAFRQAALLESASLPSATTLVDRAFYGCTSLVSVDLPAATSIGNSAFSDCTSLASVSLPSATSIGSSVFYGCTALASVDLPAATSIGNSAFYGCTGIEAVTFGPLTGTLNTNAFPAWTFYDSDGVTVLDKTVPANLANCTFEGTADKLVKQ